MTMISLMLLFHCSNLWTWHSPNLGMILFMPIGCNTNWLIIVNFVGSISQRWISPYRWLCLHCMICNSIIVRRNSQLDNFANSNHSSQPYSHHNLISNISSLTSTCYMDTQMNMSCLRDSTTHQKDTFTRNIHGNTYIHWYKSHIHIDSNMNHMVIHIRYIIIGWIHMFLMGILLHISVNIRMSWYIVCNM